MTLKSHAFWAPIAIVGFCCASHANVVPFFRSLDSRFASGNISSEKLVKNTYKVESQHWIQVVDESGHTGWLEKAHMLSDIDFCSEVEILKQVPLRQGPRVAAGTLPTILKAGDRVKVVGREAFWLKVIKENSVGWIEKSSARSLETDIGYFETQKDLTLKNAMKSSARSILGVAARTKVKPIKFQNGWAQVIVGPRVGYLPVANLASRLNFAQAIMTKDGRWRVFRPQESLMVNEILKINSDPFRRLSFNETALKEFPAKHSRNLKIVQALENVTRVGESAIRWGQGYVQKHGLVWWPIDIRSIKLNGEEELPAHPLERTFNPNREVISTEELFKKRIYDMISSHVTPHLTFASADGLYRSLDGKTWERLKEIREERLPLSIAENETIFAGPFISRDNGESFTPFVKWDRVISLLARKYGAPSNHISLLKVVPLNRDGSEVKIHLKTDSGTEHVLWTQDSGVSWGYSR